MITYLHVHVCKVANVSFLFVSQVSGYGDRIISLQNDNFALHESSILSSFRALAGLLLSLTNHDSDGRIILSRKKPKDSKQQGGYLKYVMLTGEKIFHEVCFKPL